jgi:hypothetical protein
MTCRFFCRFFYRFLAAFFASSGTVFHVGFFAVLAAFPVSPLPPNALRGGQNFEQR